MPIYEYECSECGHYMEAIQRISEDPLKECPACGQPALTKLISAAGFRLKGTGWYVTDFRDKNKSKPGDKGGAAKDDAGGKKEDTATAKDKPASESKSEKSSAKGESKPKAASGSD